MGHHRFSEPTEKLQVFSWSGWELADGMVLAMVQTTPGKPRLGRSQVENQEGIRVWWGGVRKGKAEGEKPALEGPEWPSWEACTWDTCWGPVPLWSVCTDTLFALLTYFGHCIVQHTMAHVAFLGGHFPLGIATRNVLPWGFAGPAPALGHFQALPQPAQP